MGLPTMSQQVFTTCLILWFDIMSYYGLTICRTNFLGYRLMRLQLAANDFCCSFLLHLLFLQVMELESRLSEAEKELETGGKLSFLLLQFILLAKVESLKGNSKIIFESQSIEFLTYQFFFSPQLFSQDVILFKNIFKRNI